MQLGSSFLAEILSFIALIWNNLTPDDKSPQQPSVSSIPPPKELPPCYLGKSGDCLPTTIQDLIEARSYPANQDRPDGLIPPWMDLALAKRGQKFASDHLFSLALSHLFGLFSSFYPDACEILQFSTMSDNPEKTRWRYVATAAQMFIWYHDGLKTADNKGMNETDWFHSISGVRQRHIAVANAAREKKAKDGYIVKEGYYGNYVLKTVVKGPMFDDITSSIDKRFQEAVPPAMWTNDSTVIPFNQQIQVLTQFAFIGYPILFPERLAIHVGEDDLWAFNHLWAVIGYAMGIDDKYNIAIQPDLKSARKLYQEIFETFNLPSFFHTTRDIKVLAEMTLLGTEKLVTGPIQLSPNLQVYLMYKHLLKIPAKKVYASLSFQDKLLEKVIDTTYLPQYKYIPAQRMAMNLGFWNSFYAAGTHLYGTHFMTQSKRARHAFYAKHL